MKLTKSQKGSLELVNIHVSYIHRLQEELITPSEKRVEALLKKVFPRMTDLEISDWALDVIYNDPEDAISRMAIAYERIPPPCRRK